MLQLFPNRITFDTNPYLCNQRCIMCDTHSPYRTTTLTENLEMSSFLLRKVLREAKLHNVSEIIPSTMGEPLLYSYFNVFLEELAGCNMRLNLTTNGSFPGKSIEQWAEILLPMCSDIKISLNSIDPLANEHIMNGCDTVKVMDNIKTLAKIRSKLHEANIQCATLTLQVTFMRATLHGLDDLISFAISHGLERVKGHQLWVTWEQLSDQTLYNDSFWINQWNEVTGQLKKKYGSLIVLENFLPLSSSANLVPEGYDCPFLGKEAWISLDGDFNICCAPDKLRREFGDFGNVLNSDLSELFNSGDYRNLIRSYKEYSICQNCHLRRPLT